MTVLSDHPLELRVLATLADVSQIDIAEARTAAERSRLVTDDFHNELHRAIWSAQMGLLFDGEIADFYRVRSRLRSDDQAKMPSFLEAAGQPGVSLNFAPLIMGAADDLRALTLRRNMLRFGRDIAASAENTRDVTALLANAAAMLAKITTNRVANWRTLAEVMEQTRREMRDVAEGRGSVVIPTGLKEWDRIIGGLWPTLTVIGAHPGAGKSGLIARLIINLAMRGLKVAIFSLEDQATWLAYRALSSESGLSQFVLRNRKLTEDQHNAVHHGDTAIGAYANNIFIDERGRLPSSEIVQSTRDAILNKGAKVIIVDHYGEVAHDTRSERHDLEIAAGLSELRNLAKQFGVPVVVAAHLKPAAVYPYTQHDFRNAAAFEQMSRVLVAWEKKEDVLRTQVLKATNGISPATFELPFHGPSAMVSNEAPTTMATQETLL